MAQIVSDRPLMKAIHLAAAALWLTALALIVVLGDRRALRATRRELERFDADVLLFLRTRGRSRTAGRFNGGQKAHAIVQAGLAVLFTVSGALLWLGERDTAFRLPGTIALHDAATLLLAALVVGHIMQATSHAGSLEGIRRGTVTASYAASRHASWRPQPAAPAGSPDRTNPTNRTNRPGLAQLGLAALVAAAGIALTVLLVADVAA
jgi:cytochrome b subunit of formate dehydrogenase